VTAYGTLAKLGSLDNYPNANAHLMFTRVWYGKSAAGGGLADDNEQQLAQLQRVVEAAQSTCPDLLTSIHARRRAAAEGLAARRNLTVRHLSITPLWRVVVGHGENSVHESSLTFSPTYGVPVWPGSSLKGVAAAQARAEGAPIGDMVRLFGSPRPDAKDLDPERGGVVVLDAIPATAPKLVVDVLTSHVQPYYNEVNAKGTTVSTPPAEYHNPVPVRFLAVAATTFQTTLIGSQTDVRDFKSFLERAVDDLGLGGKTAAGYGYCEIEEVT
jgi:CRISPR-associated protein Cmr6